MIAEIGRKKLKGTIEAPPSKSMTHRLLICGGLSEGRSVIRGVAPSQDILATLDCLRALGARYTFEEGIVTIDGTGDVPDRPELDCRESGSTLRFFIPICSYLGRSSVFRGSEKLLSRPLDVYENIASEQDILFVNDGRRIELDGRLRAGRYKIRGNISSQFISGLLFVLPLLDGDSSINIIPPIESRSYIELTMEALKMFGVTVEWSDERTLSVKGGQKYIPSNVKVEGDYSNAAFFEGLNLLGSEVEVKGLNEDSIQGDKAYREFFRMLEMGTPTIHLGGCPDLGPVLFALAAAKNGAVFTGTRRLKLKESDRSSAMAEELRKFGVSVKVEEDSVLVYPIDFRAPGEILKGHNDHRVVMSLAILLTAVGGAIEGAEAVTKSMPDFFEKLESIGGSVKYTYQGES